MTVSFLTYFGVVSPHLRHIFIIVEDDATNMSTESIETPSLISSTILRTFGNMIRTYSEKKATDAVCWLSFISLKFASPSSRPILASIRMPTILFESAGSKDGILFVEITMQG